MESKKVEPIGDPTEIKRCLEVVIKHLEWMKVNNLLKKDTKLVTLEELKKMRKGFSLY